MQSTKTTLAARLSRHFAAGAAIAAAVPFMSAAEALASVQYTPVNLVIPANIDGLYINVETLATGTTGATTAGWDLNPYSATSLTWFNATGTGMLRYPGTTIGSAGNLAFGTSVGSAGSYGSGAVTVGSAPGNWQLNAANYFAFKFTAADGQTHYGWGKFVVGASISGADRKITELAWETAPNTPIAVGDTGASTNYDPCGATNPVASIGSNVLPINQNAANLALGACGTSRKANYYRFTAPETRNYDIDTCSGTSDTVLAVLSDCTGGASVIACNNDFCGTGSKVTLSATAGTTYYIVLGSATSADLPNPYNLQIKPWYLPCDPTNPTASNGTNNLAIDSATAATLKVGAGCNFAIYGANYFKYTPTESGSYTINTCSSGADTRIAVVDDCISNPSVLACNDNACGLSSSVTLDLFGTVPVYIVVGSASPSASLASPIAVTVVPPPLPACVTASAAVFGDNAFDNSGATTPQTAKSSAAGTTTGTINKAVWFTFRPAVTGAYKFSTCGTSGDTIMAIGDVCPGVGARFEALAYNDDAPCASAVTLRSFIDATNNGATGTFAGFPLAQDLVAGQTYYICAGSYGATTTITGTLNIDGPPQTPPNPADLDGDGVVGPQDLAILLSNWGNPGGQGDVNGDGTVGASDLGALLNAWTA